MALREAASEGEDGDEDDYMSMTIAEPVAPLVKETYTQRRRRLEREAEVRGRPKSKAELALEAKLAREVALSKSLLDDPATAGSNKGLRMMAKMGFRPGQALGTGANGEEGRLEPITLAAKEDRGGIGMDSEKRKRIRDEYEEEAKRAKVGEGDYRERIAREREDTRLEGLLGAAMRIAERMTDEREEAKKSTALEQTTAKKKSVFARSLKQINVLWRDLARKRQEKERDRQMRHNLVQSLSRLPTYEDDDEDDDYAKAMGKGTTLDSLVEDLDEDDPELDDFNALDLAERLRRLVDFLRTEYNYCFWCKYAYPDSHMEGCPGTTEEDHD